MRFVRIPFYYLPNFHLKALIISSVRTLNIIHDIHNDIPNRHHYIDIIRFYQYHPSFIRWVHAKTFTELLKRGECKKRTLLPEKIVKLKSKKLIDIVPPNEEAIAEDIAWCFQQWAPRFTPGGQPVPSSYLEIARRHYDIEITEANNKRIDEVSGVTIDSEQGWYYPQGEEQAQVADDSLGAYHRLRRNERR